MNIRLSHFCAGTEGLWAVRDIRTIRGASLPAAERLHIADGDGSPSGNWTLRGVRSNARYTTSEEKAQLEARQEGLGRRDSTLAAHIPIKKNEAWWQLSQDQRRQIFEEQSKHTSVGLQYLPAIARRLYHCRDLNTAEPFDFLTWFEFSPDHERDFDDLLLHLCTSSEWDYVEREVDIRLVR
ncbi:MAG: chlorite dismutase family protein [Candidatus Methylacidiphilales bacterium]|nr:chlorite dismutase family protein [Candidatus Methylacidiphilales bacterium]